MSDSSINEKHIVDVEVRDVEEPLTGIKYGIDFDAIPGTSQLVEEDSENGEIVLIPTPSDDPNDPLNWSYRRKMLQMFCIILYCYGGSVPGCCIYSIITEIAADPSNDLTVGDLNAGTGYSFLFLGLGGLVMLPLAQQYGKRPIYLLGMLGVLCFNIWGAYVKTNGDWIASKILNGFFYCTIESLPEITVTDMFFEHERATYMGIYGAALFSSNYAAPMLAGFVNDALGWRWTLLIACIFCAVCLVFMFLFMEETNYERKLRVTTDADGRVLSAVTSAVNPVPNNDLSAVTSAAHKIGTEAYLGNQARLVDANEPFEYAPEKTWIQKMSLTGGVKSKFHLFDYMKAPFYMLQFPVVLYSGFLYGSSLFWYSVLNGTEALILGAEPYNFSGAMCGLAYVSPVIFVFIIYPYAGWSTDWIKIYLAKKKNGKSEAEDRLWVLIVYMILGPASLILWGVGAAHGIHWIGVVIGLGLLAGLCVVGCVSSVTYALDCYPEMGVSAITVLVIIRNTMNFAMDYGITDFVTNLGTQNCFIASAFICLFCISTFFIMEWTGLYWRKKTKNAYWSLVAKYRAKGVPL
ncbi:hypothetical protein DAMA08_007010 [Martiniozyma asiatica (nom. inval.)]|nr:hypothetical protein DAMA08_007010 [Martiniozyma asiatica]